MDETGSSISRVAEAASEARSPDDVLDVLADRQRRHLLAVLNQLETPERLSALARNLAAATGRSGDDEAQELQIRLYHHHVPKLEAAGIVSYDDDRGTVELTELGRTLAAALDR